MVVVALMVVYANMLQYPSAMHPQHSEYFVMAVPASGSQNFPVPGCFKMLLPHLVPRQAEHKSKVKFFTRTKLSAKNFTFTCALDVLANNSGSGHVRLPNNFVIVFCGLPRELYILKASEIKRSTFLK